MTNVSKSTSPPSDTRDFFGDEEIITQVDHDLRDIDPARAVTGRLASSKAGQVGLADVQRVRELVEPSPSRAFRILLMLAEQPATASGPQVLVTVWDEDSAADMIELATELRQHGVRCETTLEPTGLGAQLRYATQRDIPVAVIRGPHERTSATLTVKNLATGEQSTGARADLVDLVQKALA